MAKKSGNLIVNKEDETEEFTKKLENYKLKVEGGELSIHKT